MASSKKKVVVTTGSSSAQKVKPTVSRQQSRTDDPMFPMIFSRYNFIYLGIGLGLIFLGFLLMSGGHMPSPEVWDDNIIYSTRRTLIAPIVILLGLAINFVAIFKK